MQAHIFLLTSFVAAASTSIVTRSEVDIFPLFTARPAITPSMDSGMSTSILHTSTLQDGEAKLNLPRAPVASSPPAIEAPHTWPGNIHPSAAVIKSRSLGTSSTVVLTLPSYLQWVTSTTSSKTSTKSPRHSVSALSTHSTSTPAYEDSRASTTASPQTLPEGFGGDTGDDQWMFTRPDNAPKSSASENSASVISILWQPPKSNSARRLGVPKLLLGLLSMRAVGAANLERVESAVTSAPTATLTASLDHTLPSSAETLICPQGQEGCSRSICYDPKAQWCSPYKVNVCQKTEACAKADMSKGDWTCACGPLKATNGNPRIHTTSINTSNADIRTKTTATSTTLSTTTGKASASGWKSTSTTAGFSYPTGSGGARLGVPSIVQNIILLARSTAAFASPIRPECCADICCDLHEVCARSSTGPKCWPKAGQRVARRQPDEADTTSREIALRQMQESDITPVDEESHTSSLGESKIVVPAAAGAAVGAAAGAARNRPHKKGNAARPTTPTLFYMFLLLTPFVAANFPSSLPRANDYGPIAGARQTDPSTKATTNKRWLFGKRWSCHKPNQNCGSSGCWDPASQFCCNQPDGHYGLCAASNGESCCGKMCCPENTECRNEGDFLCYPKNSSL